MSGFKLSSAFTLWVQDIDKMNKQQYSSSLREVTTFSQLKQFWQLFQFLKPTSQLTNCDMYLFKEGVKPMWEDINNVGGGCIKIKIQKRKSNKLWESTVFSTISPKNKFIDIMNGIRIKIRESFDQIEIWLNSGANEKDRLDGLKGFLKENTQITDDRVYNFFPFGKK